MILSANSSSASADVRVHGYLAQPVIARSVNTGVNAAVQTGFIRTVRQFGSTIVSVPDQNPDVPLIFGLEQNYPNPFNPETVIPFTIDRAGSGEISIFNLLGQTVRDFQLSDFTPGQYKLTWDGKSNTGLPVPSGQYFVRLSHDSRMQVRKMMLLK